jgi:type II secretory pathway component GspD/PulD (secretin)
MKALRSVRGSVCSIAVLLLSLGASAQTQPEQLKQLREMNAPEEIRTYFLNNVTEKMDGEEILNDLRNLLPHTHAYYAPSEGALTVRATAEEMALAEKLIAELDRKRKVYKITYSITDIDAGKLAGTQHVELILPTGSKTMVKQGTRVPIMTEAEEKDSGTPRDQVQYVDIGLNIEASLEGGGEALRLETRVEQSSIGDERSGIGAQDPVIRQTKMEGWSTLTQGKPTLLGSLDIPGTARHEEISVVSELVK